MPQRTHGPTTAAAKPSAAPKPPPREPRVGKSGKSGTGTGARGKVAPHAPDQAATAAPDREAATPPDAHPLAPELIARTLRAVAGALERDPALARRVAADAGFGAPAGAVADSPVTPATPPESATTLHQRAFRPRLVTGADAALGPGIPDPFALRAARGEVGLRAVLEELRLGTLRAIIRTHHLDPSGHLARQNDAARLRVAIVDATAAGAPPAQ